MNAFQIHELLERMKVQTYDSYGSYGLDNSHKSSSMKYETNQSDQSDQSEIKINGGKTSTNTSTNTKETKETEYIPVDYTVDESIPLYYPKYTRQIMSDKEFEGAITSLAMYYENLPSIGNYIDDSIDVNVLLNPSEIAYKLVKAGKLDCIIVRNHGAEPVSFSVLKQNPVWSRQADEYFNGKFESMKKELYDPIIQSTKK